MPVCSPTTDVAAFQRAAFDKHGGNRAAPLIQLRLNHHGLRLTVGVGGQFHDFGLERQFFEQFVKVKFFQCRNLNILNLAAHLFDDDFMFEQAFTDLLRVRAFLVDFVDRDDERYASGLLCLIASMVCGIRPSSAATTRITISVTIAPRWRIR